MLVHSEFFQTEYQNYRLVVIKDDYFGQMKINQENREYSCFMTD